MQPDLSPPSLPPLSARLESRVLGFLDEPGAAGVGEATTLIGATLGGCSIEKLIGRGGMGEVYLATHVALNKKVAVKVLLSWLFAAPKVLERFQREAQLAAQLDHPNVLSVLHAGCEDGIYFQVLPYVDGESLAVRLARLDRLPIAEALDVFEQAARGLGAAHARGIVHRDIKPANLLLARDGTVKVADFGLARDVLAPGGMTTQGRRLGTLYFMAPEQAEGKPVDRRADLYALGATLYTMLAGRMPFQGESPAVTLQRILTELPAPLASQVPGLAPEIDALTAKLLEKDPARRYADADALLRDLEVARRAPAAGPRWRRWLRFGGR